MSAATDKGLIKLLDTPKATQKKIKSAVTDDGSVIAYDADEDWKNPLEEGIHAGQQDASIVATHIMR